MNRGELLLYGILLAGQFYVYPFGGSVEFLAKLVLRGGTLGLIIFWLVVRGGVRLVVPRSVAAYSLYAISALALLSVTYSSDVAITSMRAADLMAFVVMGLFFSFRCRSPIDVVRFVGYVLCVYLAGFFILAYVADEPIFRVMGVDGVARLGGVIVNPNIFAYAILFLLAVLYFHRGRFEHWKLGIAFCVLMVGLYFCYSRSAYIALVLGGLFLLRPQSGVGHLVLLAARLAMLMALAINLDIIVEFLERGHGIENLLSLGGRTTIWAAMLNQADFGFNVLWGFGYQMLSSSGLAASQDGLVVTMAHNNFLQTFLGLGLLGTLLHVFFWIYVLRSFFARGRRSVPESGFYRLIALFAFCYSLVEYGIFGPPTIIAPVFVTVALFEARRRSALKGGSAGSLANYREWRRVSD